MAVPVTSLQVHTRSASLSTFVLIPRKEPLRLLIGLTKNAILAFLVLAAISASNDDVSRPVVFVNVHLIPMDRERVLKNRTVVIRKDRIAEIGDANKIRIPEGALTIDGHGFYLMPGLSDMHFHLHNRADMLLLLANGVTTIRNMRGTPLHLAWREQIRSGKMLGPAIYTCGPILDGNPPTGENMTVLETPEEIEQNIASQKESGYDCIKVYNKLSREAYSEIIRAAKIHGLPVTGHVPSAVGLAGALQAGQSSIEHLTGYMPELKSGAAKITKDRIRSLARATKAANVWNCPTLVVQQKLAEANDYKRLLRAPEMKYVAPLRLALWNPTRATQLQSMTSADFDAAGRGIEVLKRLVKALQDADAGILLGTDAPSRFVVPGFSVHEELQNFVESGLSPYQALRTATRNPAEYLNALSEFGTLETGKRADLILVRDNPLEDLTTLRSPAGVMVRGQWLPKTELNAMLEGIVKSYEVPADRFASFPPLPESMRFRIEYDGLTVGEERIAVQKKEDGQLEILSQLITDPPLDAQYTTSISENELMLDSRRPEGNGHIEVKRTGSTLLVTGRLPIQNELARLEEPLADGTLLHCPLMAARLLLSRRLAGLTEGSIIEIRMKELDFGIFSNKAFELRDRIYLVKREPYEGGRRFNLQSAWNHQVEQSVLIVDDHGIPLSFHSGLRAFNRIE